MSQLFVAIDLGEEAGRVMLGTLHQGNLRLSEVLAFDNVPAREKDAVLWDMASLYQATISGLREIGVYNEPVAGISCISPPAPALDLMSGMNRLSCRIRP